jgi:hypothetical protein
MAAMRSCSSATTEEFARVIASEIPPWTAVARDHQIQAD